MSSNLILAIDASRNRSGGAVAHLCGILNNFDYKDSGYEHIHIWTHKKLAKSIPNYPWLTKHTPTVLSMNIVFQLLWQRFILPYELRKFRCNILFTTDASTLCRFSPSIVLSQDLLSYEPGAISLFRFGYSKLRLYAIYFIQNRAFLRSNGVIFLTDYAKALIQSKIGMLEDTCVIPHGINQLFKDRAKSINQIGIADNDIKCIYVSNADLYKHQWVVIEAIHILRNKGYNIRLDMYGGGDGLAQNNIRKALCKYDNQGVYIKQHSFVLNTDLPDFISGSDIFIFASSCENLPVTLLEGMAMGMPIACSDRGPMPEVLKDAGSYFNPESPQEIADAVEFLILNTEKRLAMAKRALIYSQNYDWESTSSRTFKYIYSIYKKYYYTK